jgi:periplasmic divalent cation tolerance protein
MQDNTIQVLTTTEKKEDAENIARDLIDRRLAACVQIIGPMVSTYRWQGKIEKSEEWLCLIKTREDIYAQVEAAVKAIHPYETPEILAVPVSAGSADYLKWLTKELKEKA